MKRKLLSAIIIIITLILSSANIYASSITMSDGQSFESEDAFWEYLEDTYPIVYYDDIRSGKYTDQYVIIDSYVEKVTIDELIKYITCDMYFLQSDGKYKKRDVWSCFYEDEDLCKYGFISGKDYLLGMKEGDTFRGCYKVNSDNSFGPNNMLAIKKTDIDSSNITLSDSVYINFSSSVTNDVTGNWRLSTTNTDHYITDYALNYYKAYFKSNTEIHGIINFSDKTTSSLSIVGGELNIAVHEYIDGEENDAKILFGGKCIAQYYINLDTGKIEKV